MVDAQANIRINLDSSKALAELKALEQQISLFNKSIIQGTATGKKIQQEYTESLIHNINATGKFSASMGKVMTETERFTNALETNKLSAREYFRYSMASTKTFGRLFGKEFGTITKVAEERVKLLQTRHIELGRAADGAMRAVKVVPESLDFNKPLTQLQLVAQRQQIFNQLLDAGTTKLLNFGKNTQWAGRQLMVGFTIPLSILGGVAMRTFRDLEEQAIRFKKVYGDMFTGEAETQRAFENIQKLGKEFTKYGVTVADTLKLAADAAQAGNVGKQLEDVVTQTTRLAVLGDVPAEKAFDTAIAIQNAFQVTGQELTNAINFLNAVENQTVVALDDISEAIPKVASVVSTLGGDIQDLALFMAAMKEGGIQASDGANALKTSLGRLINPTKAAVQQAADLGINLRAIVDENAGDLRMIMLTFAEALKPLDDLAKARLMEKVFGKFQFARMTTLFNNLSRSGSQAARVMELTAQSTEQLGMLAENELGVVAESAATKFTKSIEELKVSLAPLGEAFIKLVTPVVELLTKMLEKFNGFSDTTKKVITGVIAVLGGIGPVLLMGIGLVANGVANLLKFINLIRKGYQSLTGSSKQLGMSTSYLTQEQLEAMSVANNLHLAHEMLTDQYALEASALARLTGVYQQATAAARGFASSNPGMFLPGTLSRMQGPNIARFGKRFADGGWVPGTGNKDTVPAVLMPGEFVVTKDAAKANAGVLEQMNQGKGQLRGMGTPGSAKVQYRNGGSGSFGPIDDKRNWAHVGVRRPALDAFTQTEVDRLLKDERLTPATKQRLQIASPTFNALTSEHLRKIAVDYGIVSSAQAKKMGYGQLLTAIENRTRVNGINAIKRDYANKLYAYTNEVVDTGQRVQSGVTARGSRETGTTTPKQYREDIKYNRNTFAAGLYRGVLTQVPELEAVDPNYKLRKEIMRSIAKKTENELRRLPQNIPMTEQQFMNAYRSAEEQALKEKIKDPALKKKIDAKLAEHRRNVTTFRVGAENVSSMYRKGSAIDSYRQWGEIESTRKEIRQKMGIPLGQRLDRALITGKRQAKKAVATPKGRWGAAAAIGAVGSVAFGTAAGAVGRSAGTPAYGEQGVTPAMLTPGEFVMNAKAAQQYGPELIGMNQGGLVLRGKGTPGSQKIAYRQNPPNIPGYTQTQSGLIVPGSAIPTQDLQAQAQAGKVSRALQTAINGVGRFGKAAVEASYSVRKLDNEQKQAARQRRIDSKEDRRNKREQKRIAKEEKLRAKNDPNSPRAMQQQRLTERMNKVGMLGFAVSMGAMGVSAATEGRTSEIAGTVSQVAGGLAMVAYLLPMLTNPIVLLSVAAGGAAAAFMLYNKAMRDAADKGYEMAQALGVTADEIKKVSEATGQVSLSEVGQRMREERQRRFTPIEADFGVGYMESEAGQMLLDQIKEFEKQGLDSGQEIARKLSGYVADGLMTAAQAEGIIAELGRQLGSTSFAIKVSGEMQEIIGFGGVNLMTDPMIVRVKIVEETEESTSGYIEGLKEELRLLEEGAGGMVASERAREEGKGFFGQFWATFKSNFRPGLLRNEISGAIAGTSDLLLETTQQQIDAGKVQYDLTKAELEESERLLRSQLASTTNAENRAKIELELANVVAQRNRNEESFAENNKVLIDKQIKQYEEISTIFNEMDKKGQKALLETTTRSLRERFKGTAEQGTLNEVLSQTEKLEDKSLTYRINTLISSDQLSVTNAATLLEMFTDEGMLDEEVTRMVRIQGLESVNRTLDNLTYIEDKGVAAKLFSGMSKLDTEGFNAASMFLETAIGIPSPFSDIFVDATVGLLNPEQMKAAGEDLMKIEDQLKDLNKLKGEERIAKILEFVTSDEDFAVLKEEAEYFNSLDDVSVKQFLSIFRMIREDYDPLQAEKDWLAKGGTQIGFNAMSPDAMKNWWIKNVAVPRAQEFQKLIDEITPPVMGGEEGPAGGGSQSLPITTKQLLELRLKGLDPAAASSLDYESAAKVLNGTIKQQKQAIALLNEELRDNAIRNQLLRTDQQELEDKMKAASDAIGAYITLIEEARIKPIQDQIDAFNELSDTQQDQIEQYQRGLQKLSEKEDSINKIYDERIEAIDKVSEANERSAQRQQRQIDLASAIASGDFAAAAAAQAEITSTEAEYALEDTLAALEERRQQELKNLTIEVNGQLFTREQIETNIKSLEEQIYQTTLLVRQEQEKIVAIEKEITAEKDKQRRFQVLGQMASLSQQIGQTVDQTQRSFMLSQLQYLGQSVGISNIADQSQFDALGESLGISLSGITTMFVAAQKNAERTSQEFLNMANEVFEKNKNISSYLDRGTQEGLNSLSFLSTLSKTWGSEKNGMVVQGTTIQGALIDAGNAIVRGKKAIQDAINEGVETIKNSVPQFGNWYSTGTGKKEAFGGLITYGMGGKVKRYAMGGNVNYRVPIEPAPVRMAMGSIVPGLGNTDRVPALLTPGEFVVRKSVAQENMGLLKSLNGDVFPQFGGVNSGVEPQLVTNVSAVGGTNLYNNNYSVNVNIAGADASANDIANVVVRKLKTMNDRNIRGSRF